MRAPCRPCRCVATARWTTSARRPCSWPRRWRATSPARHSRSTAASRSSARRCGTRPSRRCRAASADPSGHTMEFEYSSKTRELVERVSAFMDAQVYPNEQRFRREVDEGDRWAPVPLMEELKAKAKAQGLWNLFLPESDAGAGLTNLEYAPLCEVMGRVLWAAEAFNCSAPDTGNMEVLERYGSVEQKERWLKPLLAGEIRSCFAMTEPAVASSDATNRSEEPRLNSSHVSI